ncbi:hypothetical protein MS3_00001093 [Schistosoma haematobium]|uniref:Uncharacterized protein n=1 Tax=Schistosoma haematobium TaxID=6185 RepID=A0A922S4A9_SCHHA|nr:hypothetical protein MS3_00001093 [Schistosoma haematobium]KAH9593551.1 hypothetical protein MS3_00001093 [Schistosoma haematobium]
MMSSSSAGTIFSDRSSLRGDDVFISCFKSSCFDKELASDSTLERMSVSCLKTVFNSLLTLLKLFDLDVELIIKLETESSNIRCGVRPIPTLSASKGVAEKEESIITELLLSEVLGLFRASFLTVDPNRFNDRF